MTADTIDIGEIPPGGDSHGLSCAVRRDLRRFAREELGRGDLRFGHYLRGGRWVIYAFAVRCCAEGDEPAAASAAANPGANAGGGR